MGGAIVCGGDAAGEVGVAEWEDAVGEGFGGVFGEGGVGGRGGGGGG